MKKILKQIDKTFFRVFNKKMKNNFFDWLMPKYTNLGSLTFIVVVLLILLFTSRFRSIGIQLLYTLTISQTITYVLKALVKRDRPYDVLKDINTYGMVLKDHSFPSGHSSASFSLALVLAFNFPKLTPVFIGMSTLVAISRVYLGVHYGTDIIFGSLLGSLSAFIVYYI